MEQYLPLAGLLLLMLLAGCAGQGARHLGEGIGDAQVAAQQAEPGESPGLLDEDVVERPEAPSDEAGALTAEALDDSGMATEDEWSEDLILEEDVVERG